MSKSILFLSSQKRHFALAITVSAAMFLMTERLTWGNRRQRPHRPCLMPLCWTDSGTLKWLQLLTPWSNCWAARCT